MSHELLLIFILILFDWVDIGDAEKNLESAGVLDRTKSQRKMNHQKNLDLTEKDNEEKEKATEEKIKKKMNQKEAKKKLLFESRPRDYSKLILTSNIIFNIV